MREKITIDYLKKKGFKFPPNGKPWINLHTHYVELIPVFGFFCPVIGQISEFNHEDEQRVSIERIQYVDELKAVIKMVKGIEI